MPLDRKKAESFIGASLELQPAYGWGWLPDYPWRDCSRDELPPRSRFRLDGLFEFQGRTKWGFGQFSPEDMRFPGFWLCFELRTGCQYDFEGTPQQCDLTLRRDPPLGPTNHVAAWDQYDLRGYCYVGIMGFILPRK